MKTRKQAPKKNLNFNDESVKKISDFIAYISKKYNKESNLPITVCVLECLMFIKLNKEWITYAMHHPNTYCPRDTEQNTVYVLKAENNMLFHITTPENEPIENDAAIKQWFDNYGTVIESIERAIDPFMKEPLHCRGFIQAINDSAYCMEHRLRAAMDVAANAILVPDLKALDTLFGVFEGDLEQKEIDQDNLNNDFIQHLIYYFFPYLNQFVSWEGNIFKFTAQHIKEYRYKYNLNLKGELSPVDLFENASVVENNNFYTLFFLSLESAERYLLLIRLSLLKYFYALKEVNVRIEKKLENETYSVDLSKEQFIFLKDSIEKEKIELRKYFIAAVEEDDAETIVELLKYYPELKDFYNSSESVSKAKEQFPIYIAAERGNIKILETLASYGFDFALLYKTKSDFTQSSLRFAAENNHFEALKFIINTISQQKKQSLEDVIIGKPGVFSVLHFAALYSDVEIVEYLVKNAPGAIDKSVLGETPLLCAIATNRNFDIVKQLLSGHKKELDEEEKKNLRKYFIIAIEKDDAETMVTLLKYYPELKDFYNSSESISNAKEQFPIYIAAQHGNMKILETLASYGFDFALLHNTSKPTLTQSSLRFAAKNNDFEALKFIIDTIRNQKRQSFEEVIMGNPGVFSVLHFAAIHSDAKTLKYLVDNAPGAIDKSVLGEIPLLCAIATNRNVDVVKQLLSGYEKRLELEKSNLNALNTSFNHLRKVLDVSIQKNKHEIAHEISKMMLLFYIEQTKLRIQNELKNRLRVDALGWIFGYSPTSKLQAAQVAMEKIKEIEEIDTLKSGSQHSSMSKKTPTLFNLKRFSPVSQGKLGHILSIYRRTL